MRVAAFDWLREPAVLDNAEVVAALLADYALSEQEHFFVVALNGQNECLAWDVVAKGTAHQVEVHPRDIFRFAVRHNAMGIVVAHNHPSGSLEFSADDVHLTSKLRDAGGVLGIPVIDHVLLSRRGHLSMAREGLLT